jgi:hypothetical protein
MADEPPRPSWVDEARSRLERADELYRNEGSQDVLRTWCSHTGHVRGESFQALTRSFVARIRARGGAGRRRPYDRRIVIRRLAGVG